MTEKTLSNLKQLLMDARIGEGGLAEEELNDIFDSVEHDLYKARLEGFVFMLDNAMPSSAADSVEGQRYYEETMEKFYNTQWHITFGEHKVVVDNGATIFQGILSILKDIINNEL